MCRKIFIALLLMLMASCLPSGRGDGSGPDRQQELAADPLNATYEIAVRAVSLRDGRSEISLGPGATSKIRTEVLGAPLYGDLDGDGDADAALLLVQDPGGSGTFFYVTAALHRQGYYHATNTVLLGDRIDPEGLAIHDMTLHVRFKDRRPEEPMATVPTVEKTIYLAVENGKLVPANSSVTGRSR